MSCFEYTINFSRGWYVASAQISRPHPTCGVLTLGAEGWSRTSAGALATVLRRLADGLDREHHDERRRA